MKPSRALWAFPITAMAMVLSSPVEARHHHRHAQDYQSDRDGHGRCLRFNKTTGTVVGAVGGGVLGHTIIGGPGGLLVGAAAGGVAGHELAHNRRKRCR